MEGLESGVLLSMRWSAKGSLIKRDLSRDLEEVRSK